MRLRAALDEMHQEIPSTKIKVLELMAGCGRNVKTIKEFFPDAQVKIVDGSQAMIAAALKKGRVSL